MKKTVTLLVMAFFWALGCPALAQQSKPLPIFPQSRQTSRPDDSTAAKAHKLYALLRHENQRLRWDSCLASKAIIRARRMAKQGYFDHEDPKTGRNPVWESVNQCVPFDRKRYRVPAGENLAKGIDTPAHIHRALMESPTHRKNILDPRFSRVGVGCYDNICVELFLGL
jgi:uncharacterized protein YkwD